ncbi:DUF5362 family protein [Ekhidna sp. MALMAid0563]|uniref:DUF5362 family protein n=1 Tax=Ekhidna sp. MALMAid0563 TaxID=3143937 RepID=UPI0032DEF0CE
MEEKELQITGTDKSTLLETAKWGKFLGIVGFIMSGFIILAGIFMFGGTFDEVYPGFGGGIGVFYILISLLYIFPSLYLFRFSTQMKEGLESGDQERCTNAFNYLRRLFLFMGILTIVVLALYALVFLGIFLGGAMGGML